MLQFCQSISAPVVGQTKAVDLDSFVSCEIKKLIARASSTELLFLIFPESLNFAHVFRKSVFLS